MATKKVAGRVREHSPAVDFPENFPEPESDRVNVPHATALSADVGSLSRRAPRATVAAILMLAAAGCFIAALVELPEHVAHAALLIVAGAALWLVGEAVTR
jgi:hypothetical protein